MKNAKKILLVLLAIVALTLVMSISVFAEEPTYKADTVAVVDGVEYNSFDSAFKAAPAGSTLKLVAAAKTTYFSIEKAITIDFNGQTLTVTNSHVGFRLRNEGIVFTSSAETRGTLNYTGRVAALAVFTADRIENINIVCSYNGSDPKQIGGIVMQEPTSAWPKIHLGSVKNVDMDGPGLTQGIQTYNCGGFTNPDGTPFIIIDLIENVKINATNNKLVPAEGMNIYAPIGTVKDCVIHGTDIGVHVWSKGPYNTAVAIENCEVKSTDGTALSIHDNGGTTTIDISVDSATTFESTNGTAISVSVPNAEKFDIDIAGYVQNADGSIAACTDHTWVDATCTAPKTCSKCNATEGDALGHTLEGEGYVYVAPTCKDAGYDAETCTVCGETVVTFEYPADPTMHAKDWETEARNDADTGYTYTCTVCGGIVEEITKGTTSEPITVEPGVITNTVYAEGAQGVVYQIAVSKYGKLTITFETADGSVMFADSLMAFMRGMSFYTFGTEFLTVVDPDNLWTGYYYFAVPANVASFNVALEAQERPVLSLGENTIIGTSNGTKVTISTPGDYILTAPNGANLAFCPDENTTDNIYDFPFEFTVDEGETLAFIVLTSGWGVASEEVLLVLEENKPAHVHTEEEIPAVLPTPSNVGYTAGVKCSECGEVLEAPEEIPALGIDANYKFASANINLSESIALKFYVNIPAGYENTYVVFNFLGEDVTVTKSGEDTKNGMTRYIFTLAGILPIYMNETITATVYTDINGEVISQSMQYSVKKYCTTIIGNAKSSVAFKTVVTDLLAYGEAAQIYVGGYTEDQMITKDVDMTYKTQTFEKLTKDEHFKLVRDGDVYEGLTWTGANLYAKDTITMMFYFTADDSIDLSKLQIKLTYLGNSEYISATELKYDESNDRYEVKFTNIWPIYYDEIIDARFVLDGVEVGQYVQYSVNSYIYQQQDKTTTFGDFIRALSNYSKAVCEYVK